MDMSLIEAAYCPEVLEEECVRLVADSMPLVENLMEAIDVNPHHPPVQTYEGPFPAINSTAEGSENQAMGTDQSSQNALAS